MAHTHYPDNKAKRNIHLADHSGHIQMVLWRDHAENSQVVEGNVLSIKNAVVSNYHQALSLTTTFETTITSIDEVMTAAPAEEPSLSSNVVSVETTILAIKNSPVNTAALVVERTLMNMSNMCSFYVLALCLMANMWNCV